MESKAILCIAPDVRKAEAVKQSLTSMVSPEFPASILRKDSEATLFLDRHSASLPRSAGKPR